MSHEWPSGIGDSIDNGCNVDSRGGGDCGGGGGGGGDSGGC